MKIMNMTPEYYEQKAIMHSVTWKETYRGLMPDGFLNSRNFEHCLKTTKEHPEHTFIAVEDSKVIGFINFLPSVQCDKGQDLSEICALYVLKAHQRKGVGRTLLEKCFALLCDKDIILTVVKGNKTAIMFYEAMGFVHTGKVSQRNTQWGSITLIQMIKKKKSQNLFTMREAIL